jgi:hypothetical protein
MDQEIVITPDMSPEEIAALQNPGGYQSDDDNNAGQQSDEQQQDGSSDDDAANAGSQQSTDDNQRQTQEGRIAAKDRLAADAKRRAELLEQNNEFLRTKQSENELRIKELNDQVTAANAERDRLSRTIAQATVPTISTEEKAALIEEHGERGAKPFIDMRNQMLSMEHNHKIELQGLKDTTTNLPKQIDEAFGKQQANSRAAAFNEALMDGKTGVPDLGALLKDQKFVEHLRGDQWGKLTPFNAALASNDVAAVKVIRKLVDEFKGTDNSASFDSGTSGTGGRQASGGGSNTTNREALIDQWNGMLDRGEIVAAQKFASQHKLMD